MYQLCINDVPTIKFSHAQMRILISRVFSLALYLCLSNRLAYLLYHDVSECEFCPFRKFLRISKLTFLSETSTVSRINDNYSLFACLSILEIVVSKTFFIKKGDISIIWGHPTHTHTQHSLLTQHFYHSDESSSKVMQMKFSSFNSFIQKERDSSTANVGLRIRRFVVLAQPVVVIYHVINGGSELACFLVRPRSNVVLRFVPFPQECQHNATSLVKLRLLNCRILLYRFI